MCVCVSEVVVGQFVCVGRGCQVRSGGSQVRDEGGGGGKCLSGEGRVGTRPTSFPGYFLGSSTITVPFRPPERS